MKIASVLLFGWFVLLASPSHAAVTATGNVDILLAPPSSVLEGALEDDILTRMFFERNVTLASEVTGDVALLPPVAAGTIVDSYFFHFDPVTENVVQSSTGTVTFAGQILAIFTTSASLIGSHSIFGAAGTTYSTTSTSQGFELAGATMDTVTLLDSATLGFDFNATSSVDEMRVLVGVAAIPEPETYALLLAGLGLLGFAARRRSQSIRSGASCCKEPGS